MHVQRKTKCQIQTNKNIQHNFYTFLHFVVRHLIMSLLTYDSEYLFECFPTRLVYEIMTGSIDVPTNEFQLGLILITPIKLPSRQAIALGLWVYEKKSFSNALLRFDLN